MTQDSRWLITGGAGFIGSALAWELNCRGQERIVLADRLGDSDKWRNLVPLRFEDILDADDLLPGLEEDKFGEFTHVLHMGACSSTTETDASWLLRNNFAYSCRLAEWADFRKVRFLYASSAATYGDGENGMEDSLECLPRLRPLNMYGYSKHIFDVWMANRNMLDTAVGVKFFNVFGPNEDHKEDMRSLAHKAYHQVLKDGKVSLFRSHRPEWEDGCQVRDFLWIKDAVKMVLHLAESKSSGLFNLGSGGARTWNDLAAAVFRAMDRESNIEFTDMPEILREKYQYHTEADVGRLRDQGWSDDPTPLEEAVDDYVRNYLVPDHRLGD